MILSNSLASEFLKSRRKTQALDESRRACFALESLLHGWGLQRGGETAGSPSPRVAEG